jgi:hypothetical protein
MSPNTLIDETSRVDNSLVRVAMCIQIPLRCPAVTDDRSAGFDPDANHSHERGGGSVWNREEKGFTELTFDTAKYPLSFNSVYPVELQPPELAVIDFESC